MTDFQPSTSAAPTAGSLLRAARERQGIHIAALAAAIKVTPRKLDALESDRWQELPDATFVRALAQTVCRALKIDAAPVLALLPATGMVALEPTSNVQNQPFHDRPGRGGHGFAANAIRPMLWAALALMVAAVAVLFLPPDLVSSISWPGASKEQAAQPQAVPLMPPTAAVGDGSASDAALATLPAPSLDAASAPYLPDTAPATGSNALVLPPASRPDLSAVPATPVPSLNANPAAVPGAAPVAAAPVATPPAAAAVVPAAPAVAAAVVSASAATGGAHGLKLSSTAPSWVEVRDAHGELLLSRTLMPGESVGVEGALPLKLKIGNAAATRIEFRGQPLDLASRTRENVARLELQ